MKKAFVILCALVLGLLFSYDGLAQTYKVNQNTSNKIKRVGNYSSKVYGNNIPSAKTTQKVITSPDVAENGDIRNYDNDGDGRTESVNVRGYYNKNSTYVRGHYRAKRK